MVWHAVNRCIAISFGHSDSPIERTLLGECDSHVVSISTRLLSWTFKYLEPIVRFYILLSATLNPQTSIILAIGYRSSDRMEEKKKEN
ncbi:hypothetical protein PENTCL1PPCAC_11853 [Pristionchus entomophagus]|uniref:G protein-coupled receptor n=1 Tax=Pristionchus entomophagus TaxID=358040 RepID=A0AAV5T697_9BILA|nr:hypothetical protein PENTCL1PPCAC_11852 [Pristionchus entomophagus]GMS89678.1 hypothetical protein PENTCL1PPCAC_11853 [Pristionchus entomophagus]